MKKKIEEKKVVVKIARHNGDAIPEFRLSDSGVQVEMSDKDENYIKKAFTQFENAQKRLEKYYFQK